MKVIVGKRRTGRTDELIRLCAEAEACGEVSYIVVANYPEARRISERAKEFGLQIGFPLTRDEFLHSRYAGTNIRNLYLDNADSLLQSLTPVRIQAVVLESETTGGQR